MQDAVDAFLQAMRDQGIVPLRPIVADGRRQRVQCEGDKHNAKNGWYMLHLDGRPAGAFGHWRMYPGQTFTWSAKGTTNELSPEERAELARKIKADRARADREREHLAAKAARQAVEIWEAAAEAAEDHPYLVRKRVAAYGLRQAMWRDKLCLLVPMTRDGKLVGLQFIAPEKWTELNRDKDFTPGVVKKGSYFVIGGRPKDRLDIAEGYATAASCYNASRIPTVVAWDAGNLPHVAAAMRSKFPDAAIRILADNDHATEGNPGVTKATEAAELAKATVLYPTGIQGSDWNDAEHEGIDLHQALLSPDTQADEPPPEPVEPVNDWPDPVDLFGRLEPPELNPDFLPDVLGDYVVEQSALVGTDPGVIALACIVCCAAAIDDQHRVQPKRKDPTWTESARLWGAVVGDPSTKKSPGIGKALGPLRKIDLEMAEVAERDRRNYELQKKLYARDEAEWVKKGSKNAEPPPDEPVKPPVRRLVVEDVTVEALSEILVGNPHGVLCFQDELAGWFGAMDAYNNSKTGGKDRAHWLESYNGGPRRIDRIGRGSVLVPNWSVCVLGGIQPEAIRAIRGRLSDDGLLQRFMVVMGKQAHGGVDKAPDMKVIDRFKRTARYLYELAAPEASYTLSPEAQAIQADVVSLAHRLVRFTSPGMRSVFGKWEGLFARLLLTFWLVEAAGDGEIPPGVISGRIASKVAQFMTRYLLPHTIAFYNGLLDQADRMDNMRMVAHFILQHDGDVFSLRDLVRYNKGWSKFTSMEQREVMEALDQAGWIRWVEAKESRRYGLPIRYQVNPKVRERYQAEADKERTRRAESRQVMREIRELIDQHVVPGGEQTRH